MRAHRDSRFHLGADSILGYSVNGRAAHRRIGRVDYLWIDAGANSFQYGFARALGSQINRASPIEIEGNPSFVSGN